jgi:DNA-binding CsgD family transcriptional regulator
LRPSARPHGVLSRGEARVLVFSASGFSRDETAQLLGLGPETVKTQRQSAQRKLGARNTAHAVALAFARGLLTAEVLDRVARYVEAKQ